jgi:hypothetical protein
MHLSPAGNALYHSFRIEQTTVLGFLLSIDKLLSSEQCGCLESSSYPWSPEWLPMCALIRSRRRGLSPLQFPKFGDKLLNLPLLPYKSAFEVSWLLSAKCELLSVKCTMAFLISQLRLFM